MCKYCTGQLFLLDPPPSSDNIPHSSTRVPAGDMMGWLASLVAKALGRSQMPDQGGRQRTPLFRVETLEPRIMLSGSPFAPPGSDTWHPAHADQPPPLVLVLTTPPHAVSQQPQTPNLRIEWNESATSVASPQGQPHDGAETYATAPQDDDGLRTVDHTPVTAAHHDSTTASVSDPPLQSETLDQTPAVPALAGLQDQAYETSLAEHPGELRQQGVQEQEAHTGATSAADIPPAP